MATTNKKANNYEREKTYSRRPWWPDGWSVEQVKGRWVVMNKDTGEILYRTDHGEYELDAIVWADCNGR